MKSFCAQDRAQGLALQPTFLRVCVLNAPAATDAPFLEARKASQPREQANALALTSPSGITGGFVLFKDKR